MTKNDSARFMEIMADIAAVYGAQMNERIANCYWRALEDLSIERVEAGANSAMRTCEFMPRPVNIRDGGKAKTPDERVVPSYLRGRFVRHPILKDVDGEPLQVKIPIEYRTVEEAEAHGFVLGTPL